MEEQIVTGSTDEVEALGEGMQGDESLEAAEELTDLGDGGLLPN